MKKIVTITSISLSLLAFASAGAQAGSHSGAGWAGYDWGDSYQPWAAEALQPSK